MCVLGESVCLWKESVQYSDQFHDGRSRNASIKCLKMQCTKNPYRTKKIIINMTNSENILQTSSSKAGEVLTESILCDSAIVVSAVKPLAWLAVIAGVLGCSRWWEGWWWCSKKMMKRKTCVAKSWMRSNNCCSWCSSCSSCCSDDNNNNSPCGKRAQPLVPGGHRYALKNAAGCFGPTRVVTGSTTLNVEVLVVLVVAAWTGTGVRGCCRYVLECSVSHDGELRCCGFTREQIWVVTVPGYYYGIMCNAVIVVL